MPTKEIGLLTVAESNKVEYISVERDPEDYCEFGKPLNQNRRVIPRCEDFYNETGITPEEMPIPKGVRIHLTHH